MATILTIPTEILSSILQLACDADIPNELLTRQPLGFILGRVCKSFLKISQADGLDIQYAYVRGVKRMRVFLKMLRRRSIYAKRVRSLMLAEASSNDTDKNTVANLVTEILAVINPCDLRILAVFDPEPFTDGFCQVITVSTTFPALTDLYLSAAFISAPSLDSNEAWAPNLQTMHVFRMMTPPEDLLAALRRFAPNLKRLKLEVQANPITAAQLAGPLADFDNWQPTTDSFPAHMVQVVVGWYPCYLPLESKDPEIERLALSMTRSMRNGAATIADTLPIMEEDDTDDWNWEAQPVVCLPLKRHVSMDLYCPEEEQRFREFTRKWEICTAGRKEWNCRAL
ncbi:hypothetical protein EIP91_004069 [Steccherinum ochraceum]|uniref:F-box domain-containing protein n=1 Tax=Steccherinum ochraceum TaxID=92696 RepID=A0A4R0RFR2_9APHY|nr:hypothetical protein EIP91_004069 [Steccherinum ochraceum]